MCAPGCHTVWNTFETRARCPGCAKQWRTTQCLACHAMSLHEDWYLDETPAAADAWKEAVEEIEGVGSESNRTIVTTWIAAGAYRPAALDDGTRVGDLFRIRISVRIVP